MQLLFSSFLREKCNEKDVGALHLDPKFLKKCFLVWLYSCDVIALGYYNKFAGISTSFLNLGFFCLFLKNTNKDWERTSRIIPTCSMAVMMTFPPEEPKTIFTFPSLSVRITGAIDVCGVLFGCGVFIWLAWIDFDIIKSVIWLLNRIPVLGDITWDPYLGNKQN